MTKRGQLIFLWIVILLLCSQLATSGIMRLSGINIDCRIWGYSCSVILMMGAVDIALAAGLLLRHSRTIASAFLILSMCAQGYVYFLHNEDIFMMMTLASGGLAMIVLWYSMEHLHEHV